jgi:hypothetical protein
MEYQHIFLGFVNLDKGTAEAIMAAVKSFLLSKDIDIANVRFIALDGCNTMSREHKVLLFSDFNSLLL